MTGSSIVKSQRAKSTEVSTAARLNSATRRLAPPLMAKNIAAVCSHARARTSNGDGGACAAQQEQQKGPLLSYVPANTSNRREFFHSRLTLDVVLPVAVLTNVGVHQHPLSRAAV